MGFGSRLKCFLAIFVYAALNITSAWAERLDVYEGTWRQVSSNAGECPKCSIRIDRNGSRLKVVANNGWSATVTSARNHSAAGVSSVEGDGVWRNGGRAKPMKIAVVYDRGELQVMLIIDGENRPRTIAATFRK